MRSTPSYSVWIIKDQEILPIDENPRVMRSGLLSQRLAAAGCKVTWFSARFDHGRKLQRPGPTEIKLGENWDLKLLDGRGYQTNISLERIRHHQDLAKHFWKLAPKEPKPDLILTSWPSPEMCDATSSYAQENDIPLYLDVRDPWPDMFPGYFPKLLRPALWPLLKYYRDILAKCVERAEGVTAMSNGVFDWAMSYSKRILNENDKVFFLGYRGPKNFKAHTLPKQFTKENPMRIIFVSTFGKSYDVEMIVRAAKELHQKGENRVQLTLVGDGEKREFCEKEVSGIPNITFTGWLKKDQLSQALSLCHIGLLPITGGVSRFWFGNKLCEYLSYGLALISTVPSDVKDLLLSRQLGVHLGQGDFQGLVNTIEFFLENPLALEKCMKNAREVFEQEFDADVVYNRFVKHILKRCEHHTSEATRASAIL